LIAAAIYAADMLIASFSLFAISLPLPPRRYFIAAFDYCAAATITPLYASHIR